MASTMEILWKQALKTFAGRNSVGYRLCQKNFELLRSLMNKVTAADVRLDRDVLESVQMQSAPMCVVDIFENQDITIAIFILKQGVTMPMHDHPGMHGLLKVIAGTVKIDSFTLEISGDHIMEPNTGYTAIKHPGMLVKDTDDACVLTPREKNLHQISCIDGPAAFLDILSPPYDGEEYGNMRPCTFFRITGSIRSTESGEKSEKVQLVPSESPPDFFSISLEYLGPQLR
ncbi:2-aminoethanethiol dioxygenase [Neodiprion pinetum]|uniref:2-aminoethanethiol dioxygenase n=1 Tax=Neodiprion pinetum TaxID=441929 RepID=UPI001EDF31BF|nr:2-aminoethanethiol dioxygenase [Neodiprion pinetum]